MKESGELPIPLRESVGLNGGRDAGATVKFPLLAKEARSGAPREKWDTRKSAAQHEDCRAGVPSPHGSMSLPLARQDHLVEGVEETFLG